MMTDLDITEDATVSTDDSAQREEPRRYQVSANRGWARHRLRYVESGGAIEAQDKGECGLCRDRPVR